MNKEKLYIFDTTLRDGAQTEGVNFSLDEKNKIAKSLSNLGVDYLEGGWPGANTLENLGIFMLMQHWEYQKKKIQKTLKNLPNYLLKIKKNLCLTQNTFLMDIKEIQSMH